MKAGAKTVVITPKTGVPLGGNPRQENANLRVHDDLCANVIYLENAKERILLIGLDLLGIRMETCARIKERIRLRTGILTGNIMISATHTHSGPNTPKLYCGVVNDPVCREWEIRLIDDYLPELENKIVDAAVDAFENRFDCRIGFKRGYDNRFSFNRRLRTFDGKIRMIFEPFELSEIKEISDPKGCPNMNIFRIDDTDGNIRAAYVNYNAHPAIACGLDRAVSRDYIGYLTDSLKKRYGEDLVVLFTNGAEGNMVTASPETGFINSFEECRRVGEGLSDTAIRILDAIRTSFEEWAIRTSEGEAEIPVRSFTPEELACSQKILSEPSLVPADHGCDYRISAKCMVELNGRRGETDTIHIQVFRIGEAILVALPTETFYEIELAIAKASGMDKLFIVGLANDYKGYVPTREAFREGGYEVMANEDSIYDPAAAEILIREVLKTIHPETEGSSKNV